VVVDGTLSADKLVANAVISNNLNVQSTITLGTDGQNAHGQFNTPNKNAFTSDANGFFLDTTGNFYLGDATNHLKYTSSSGALNLAGSFSLAGPQGPATKVITIWKLSGSNSPSATVPSATGSVVFSTGVITFGGAAHSNGWYNTPQATTAVVPFLHQRQVTVTEPSSGTTVSVATSAWGSGGVVGARGSDGGTGAAGSAGRAFYSLILNVSAAASASLITAAAVLTEIGRHAIVGDICIVKTNNTTTTSAGFRCTSAQASGNNGSWTAATAFISGDVIVDGSIGADEITANSIDTAQLKISSSSGNERMHMDGDNNRIDIYDSNTLRVRIGNLS